MMPTPVGGWSAFLSSPTSFRYPPLGFEPVILVSAMLATSRLVNRVRFRSDLVGRW
jgi:hypothetical protein